jgi:hypothetical protein
MQNKFFSKWNRYVAEFGSNKYFKNGMTSFFSCLHRTVMYTSQRLGQVLVLRGMEQIALDVTLECLFTLGTVVTPYSSQMYAHCCAGV